MKNRIAVTGLSGLTLLGLACGKQVVHRQPVIVERAAPDLAFANLTATWEAGNKTVRAKIVNIGSALSEECLVYFDALDQTGSSSGRQVPERVPRLAVGDTADIAADFLPLAEKDNLRLWNVNLIRVGLDPKNTVPEADETNNQQDISLTRRIVLTRTYVIRNTSDRASVRARFSVPDLTDHKNTGILGTSYSMEPKQIQELENGMRSLTFQADLTRGKPEILTLSWRAEIRDYDHFEFKRLFPHQLTRSADQRYLEADIYIESDHPQIIAQAQQIAAGNEPGLDLLRAIVMFVRDWIQYKPMDTQGALWAYENRTGDCAEQSFLAVALARAAGIPARACTVESLTFGGKPAARGVSRFDNHVTAEFFIDGSGWIPVDVNHPLTPIGLLNKNQMAIRRGVYTDEGLSWYSGQRNGWEIQLLGHAWMEE